MVSLLRIHHRLRYRNGGTSSGRRGCGAGFGVASSGTVEPARRSGSSAGGLVVYQWLDERAFERGFWRGRGQRSTVAGLVRPGRRRCPAGFAAAGTVSGQGGLGGCRRRGGIDGSGGGSAELDAASFAGRNRETDRGPHFQVAAERGAQKKGGFRWRRPRHSLKGRQDADAIEWSGLRLQLLKQQAAAGDIILLFQDESEALTHPYLAHAWAKQGVDLRVEAPGQARKVAMLGVQDAITRHLIVETSATKRSTDFIALLERIDREFGPKPGRTTKPVVLVIDNGPIHTSKASRKAMAARSAWLTPEWLPKYAPELNDIEHAWRDLKRHFLAHQTFESVDHLDEAIHNAVDAMNQERSDVHPWQGHRIAA